MQANVFQQQQRYSFTPCFLQNCFLSTKSQPKKSLSSCSLSKQRSGLVWKRPIDISQRAITFNSLFGCQSVKTEQQVVNYDPNTKKSQFQRIRKKKAYIAETKPVKTNHIEHKKIPREDNISRSVSKNKLSLSSRKSNPQKQNNPKNQVKNQFLYVNDQLTTRARTRENGQKIGDSRPNRPLLYNQLKNRIQKVAVTKNYQMSRIPLHNQNMNALRVQSIDSRQNYQVMVRPSFWGSPQKNQVKNNQGLQSTRHCSNHNLFSSVSFRQSNKISVENRNFDSIQNQRSQILVFDGACFRQSNNSSNLYKKAVSFGQRIEDQGRIDLNNHNITQRLKSSPIQVLTDDLIKQQIKERNSQSDLVYSNKHTSPSVKSHMRRSCDNVSPVKNKESIQFASYINYPSQSVEEQKLKSFRTRTVQSIMSSNVSMGPIKIEQSAVMVNFFNPPKEILDQLNSSRPLSLLKKDSVVSYQGSGVFNQITRLDQQSQMMSRNSSMLN